MSPKWKWKWTCAYPIRALTTNHRVDLPDHPPGLGAVCKQRSCLSKVLASPGLSARPDTWGIQCLFAKWTLTLTGKCCSFAIFLVLQWQLLQEKSAVSVPAPEYFSKLLCLTPAVIFMARSPRFSPDATFALRRILLTFMLITICSTPRPFSQDPKQGCCLASSCPGHPAASQSSFCRIPFDGLHKIHSDLLSFWNHVTKPQSSWSLVKKDLTQASSFPPSPLTQVRSPKKILEGETDFTSFLLLELAEHHVFLPTLLQPLPLPHDHHRELLGNPFSGYLSLLVSSERGWWAEHTSIKCLKHSLCHHRGVEGYRSCLNKWGNLWNQQHLLLYKT